MKILINIILIITFINIINCIKFNDKDYHLNILNDLSNNININNNNKNEKDESTASQVIQYSLIPSNDENQFKLVNGSFQDNAIATAFYMSNLNVNGWAYLSLNSNGQLYNDINQSKAIGYLEGYLTQDLIYNSKVNYYMNAFKENKIPKKLKEWLVENIESMNTFIVNNKKSAYWIQVQLILNQIYGMLDGYNAAVSDNMKSDDQYLEIYDLFILNMFGDLMDLVPALGGLNLEYFKKDLNDIEDWFRRSQHCSASVKVTSDFSELFSGHTTWSGYYTMLRIFKSYNVEYSEDVSGTVSKRSIFSSYPGALTSIDDFYILADSKMVVIETTNSLVTNDLYHLIRPTTLLSWVRVLLSNRQTLNGKEWCKSFEKYNSGTYNNQWIIVSYNMFEPYKELKDGALYILEQIPGYVEFADQTPLLRQGSFVSYNIPFYETIYNASGYNNYTANNYSDSTIYYMSYQTCPRAEIFRNLVGGVESLEDFQSLLRYNDFENDPLSHKEPSFAISSRFDLKSDKSSPFGGTDTKITCNSLIFQNNIIAISGPTTYNNQPIFSWDNNWNTTSHLGVPNEFNFPWVSFSNTTFRNL